MTRRILLAAAVVGWALTAHGQQIYKWVDDKGVTQYTTTPPPTGKAQAIKTAPASPAPAAKTWQEQEIEFRARQVERAEAEHKEKRAQQDAARRHAACVAAQRDLRNLKEQRPVYTQDEKGERQYLDDTQRAGAERKVRDFVERECSR
jgi:hypothetical protein